jgi:hypothetical protein
MKKSIGGGAAIGAVSGLLVFAAGDAVDTFSDKTLAENIKAYKATKKLQAEAAKAAGTSAPAGLAQSGGITGGVKTP